jgi:hypothetical protein
LRYRYWWHDRFEGAVTGGRALCWIGLNPGTGDTTGRPRQSLRVVRSLARQHGFGSLLIVNLFAFRSDGAPGLRGAAAAGEDVVGDRNDAVLEWAVARSGAVLAAWGSNGALAGRSAAVRSLLSEQIAAAVHLGVTVNGEPRHPRGARLDAWSPFPFALGSSAA